MRTRLILALTAFGAPAAAAEPSPTPKVEPIAYVETYYAYNLNRPTNGITNYRGFDNRHNTFTLSNAVLGAEAQRGDVSGRLILQVGSTPSTYYLSEPTRAGTPGANATSPELWKYLQEANISWKAPVGRGIVVQGGLVPSPIGFESFAVKDNWNYSHGNVFFGLPFYHAGARATYEWSDSFATRVGVFNGWNSIVDNNDAKSVHAAAIYTIKDRLVLRGIYFGGAERSPGAPEGPAWRHHFDANAELTATRWLSLAAQADYGFEPNRIGTARWYVGTFYARTKPSRFVYLAWRGDYFHEDLATDDAPFGRTSTPLFWGGASYVSSSTTTLDLRPVSNISFRLEHRIDVSDPAVPLFFRGDQPARTQSTVLIGATAWL